MTAPLRGGLSVVRYRLNMTRTSHTPKRWRAYAIAMLALLMTTQAIGEVSPVTEDIRGRHVFRFRIDPKLPPFRFEYVGDDRNFPVEVRCYRPASATAFQRIDISDGEAPYRGCDYYFTAIDMNGDGYKDLRVLSFWGATGNEVFTVYLWNAHAGRFERSEDYSICGKPFDKDGCCKIHWNSGHAGRDFIDSDYCMRQGTLVLVKRVHQARSQADRCFYRTVEELKQGELQVVSRAKVGCDKPD
jgi:hypothetical protein